MTIHIIEGQAHKENGEVLKDGYYELVQERRTSKQNRSLHKWFSLVSEEANEKGLTLNKLFTKPQNMRITPETLKMLFKEYAKRMYNKDSTTKLTKQEIAILIEVFEQVYAERLDCTIPFPHYENT